MLLLFSIKLVLSSGIHSIKSKVQSSSIIMQQFQISWYSFFFDKQYHDVLDNQIKVNMLFISTFVLGDNYDSSKMMVVELKWGEGHECDLG
jgi:hypothetical protein